MGEDGTSGDKTGGCAEGSGSPRRKPPQGCLTVVGSLLGLVAATITVIYRGSLLGTEALLEITHWLLLWLAAGWVCRSVIHGCIGYFRRTEVEGVAPYGLALISAGNAAFAIAWLCFAIFMLIDGSGAAVTALATAIACLASFLLALAIHAAAKKAGRPRASERVRAKLRDPLDPAKSTPIGWPLIKLIDRPSPPHLLSTYVAGSLATLLLVLVLTASAALSEGAEEEPESGQTATELLQGGNGEAQTTDDPEITSSLPRAAAPNLAGLYGGVTKKAIDLFCFPAQMTPDPAPAHPTTPGVTFFCVIVSNGQLTDEFLVLAPPSTP
jgi:hypothetical protein